MLQVLIFGTGKSAEKMLECLDLNRYEILAYVDNNQSRHGKTFASKPIIAPLDIKNYKYDKIVICSTSYLAIKEQLVKDLNISVSDIVPVTYFAEIEFMEHYESLEVQGKLNKEQLDVLHYIKNKGFAVFNYPFNHAYDNLKVDVVRDETYDRDYIIHNGIKVYFKRGYKKEEIIDFYKSIRKEQDVDSPHRYLEDEFQVKKGDVVIDAGTAEGIFSLEIIEKVKKLYLVETDTEWIEALKCTFAPWKEKVVFIDKFLTDFCDEKHIKIDDFIKNQQVDFIKMDIEGSEYQALQGAKQTIAHNKHIKVDICTYHNNDDERKIETLLRQYGFKISKSKGYMIFIYNKLQPYRMAKGLIRGKKR